MFCQVEPRRDIHAHITPCYEMINVRASQISDHHEKQQCIKALYESFYKAYNPKAADRPCIVYTPDEIVRFIDRGRRPFTVQAFWKGTGG
jgi:predicted helicase